MRRVYLLAPAPGDASFADAGFIGRSVYIGNSATSSGSGIDTIGNEIVIGAQARGKGINTVQIGNCDISAVHLGCDGGGTTLSC